MNSAVVSEPRRSALRKVGPTRTPKRVRFVDRPVLFDSPRPVLFDSPRRLLVRSRSFGPLSPLPVAGRMSLTVGTPRGSVPFVPAASRKRSLPDGDAPDAKRVKYDSPFLATPPHLRVRSRRRLSSAPLFVPDDTPTVLENCTNDTLLFRTKLGTVKKSIADNARKYALLNDSVRGFEEKAFARMQKDWDAELEEMFAEG